MSQATGPPEEERWSACFRGPNNEPYLLVRQLEGGMESSVQILIHQHTGKLIVRKVPHTIENRRFTIDLVSAAYIDAFGDGAEIEMVKYLAPFAIRHPDARMYQLIESRNTEVGLPGSGQFLRESFWECYNVGDLNALAQLYQDQGIHPPPSMVARITHQVLTSIQFMLSSGQGVRHRDLHLGNILAHWTNAQFLPNIVVADLGYAMFVGEDPTDGPSVTRDFFVEDASLFADTLLESRYFPESLARDTRFAGLFRVLEQLRFHELPAAIQYAKDLEQACLREEGEINVIWYYELFREHQERTPCVAKTWSTKAMAHHKTWDLPGPFKLLRL